MSRIRHLARNRSSLSRFIASAAIAVSLAVPAVAAGYADPGTGVPNRPDTVPGGPSPELTGSSASQPVVSGQEPIDKHAGFSIGDAAVGAGIAFGLVALAGGGVAVRRHSRSTPQPIG